ncbi:hypothetical protein KY331_03520 [Candidatus Woesearchaeota archaeon]|nr:hypothetical protein [Candidatus Woesearchaeota archaeon]
MIKHNKIKKHEKKVFIAFLVILIAVIIFLKYTIDPKMSVGLSLRDPEYAYTQSVRDTEIQDCEKLPLETQQQSCIETIVRLSDLKEEKYYLYGDDENILRRYWNILGDLAKESRSWLYGGVQEEQKIEDHPLVPEREPDYSTYGEGEINKTENYTRYGE